MVAEPSINYQPRDKKEMTPFPTTIQPIQDPITDLPDCTHSYLSKFELLLTEQQVSGFNNIFVARIRSNNVSFKSWKLMKKGILSSEEI